MTKKMLLISSSRVHGGGFFEHCREAVAEHLDSTPSAPTPKHLLFVPFALADHDHYEHTVTTALNPLGISVTSIHHAPDPQDAVDQSEAIFIGGGNSFRLLKTLYDLDLINPIGNAVDRGVPYMGSSAGTNMACPTIRTTNDMPIAQPPRFDALDLIPFQINPHFIDADPDSTHQGETREQRLAEYLEENSTPVLGLREGSWLNITETSCVLGGTTGAVLFRPQQPPEEQAIDADLSELYLSQ